eukprot:1720340-Pyramimonas_sp.AAC.1
MYAVIMALKHGLLPMHIHIGCTVIVHEQKHSTQWRLHRRRPNVDFWPEVWGLIDDNGGLSDDLTVTHVKSHQTQEDSRHPH